MKEEHRLAGVKLQKAIQRCTLAFLL